MGEAAVIYARVSKKEQAEGYSLPTQVEACREYAERQGYQVVHVYLEQFTATQLGRPQLDELLHFVAGGGASRVVAYDLDRLTRDPGHLAIIEMELEAGNAQVEFVRGDYRQTAEGQLSKTVRAAIARYENRNRVERSQRGLRARAQAGQVIQPGRRPPYGYQYVKGPYTGIFVPDPVEAPVVRRIFAAALAGATLVAIAAEMDAAGIRPPLQRTQRWSPGSVGQILDNECYRGVWRYGRNARKRTPPALPAIAVPVPPLVSDDVWFAVRQRRQAARAERRTPTPYLLTGHIHCQCGSTWCGAASSGGKHRYYICRSKRPPATRHLCPARRNLPAAALEEAVWADLVTFLLDGEQLHAALSMLAARQQAGRQARQTDLADLAVRRQRAQAQLSALLDRLLAGEVAPSAAARQKAQLLKDAAEIDGAVNVIRAQEDCASIAQPDWDALRQMVRNGAADLGFEQQRQILDLLDVQLHVSDAGITVKLLGGALSRTVAAPPTSNRRQATGGES